MKILSPLNTVEEIGRLIDAGADLFYAGLSAGVVFDGMTDDGRVPVNCRPQDSCNFTSLMEFRSAVSAAHARGKEVYFTANTHFYPAEHRARILGVLETVPDVDGVILADINLALSLRDRFPEMLLIASTEACVLNAESVDFWAGLGIGRAILPRHLTLDEIERIARARPAMELECFVSDNCDFFQGNCNYVHETGGAYSVEAAPCKVVKDYRFFPAAGRSASASAILVPKKHERGNYGNCGACALHTLERLGVHSVKIVGRGFPIEKKLRDLAFIRFAVDRLHHPKEEFETAVKGRRIRDFSGESPSRCMY